MRQRNAPGHLRRTDYSESDLSRNQSMDALGEVVYAARLSDGTIKIGHTGKLSRRLHKLASYRQCGVELLAVVPGSRSDEAAIHAGLVEHRAVGHEYYRECGEVLAVVNKMRQQIGLLNV